MLTACGPPPTVQYAHLLERAASWASAAELTASSTDSGSTPHAFAKDFATHAQQDLAKTASSIDALSIDPGRRAQAATICRLIADAIASSDRDRIGRLEAQARALASQARGAAWNGA